MKKNIIIHLDSSHKVSPFKTEGILSKGHKSICGTEYTFMTPDIDKVTCKRCKRCLKSIKK